MAGLTTAGLLFSTWTGGSPAVLAIVLRMVLLPGLLVGRLAGADTGLPPPDHVLWTVTEPPAQYARPDGTVTGFCVDVVQEIQRRVGDTRPIELVPEERAMVLGAAHPRTFLFSFSRTPEREDRFHWITPLLRKSWVFYGLTNRSLTLGSLTQARQLDRIGVVRGDVRALWLKSQGFTNLEEVATPEQNLIKLQAGRIQAVCYEPQGMAWYCRQHGIPAATFSPLMTARTSQAWLLLTKAGSDPTLVASWTTAARACHEDRTYEQIARRWQETLEREFGIASHLQDGLLEMDAPPVAAAMPAHP